MSTIDNDTPPLVKRKALNPKKKVKRIQKTQSPSNSSQQSPRSPRHGLVAQSMDGFVKKKKKKTEYEHEDPMKTKLLSITADGTTEDYRINKAIGRGAYGEVFQGINIASGEFVAIKQMKIHKKSVRNEVAEEIRLLKRLAHQHIVRYINSTQLHGALYIVMEYMDGSLLTIVKQLGSLTESLASKYIGQVLAGLAFIHAEGVVHRDIKAANILVTKSGSVKIADFGVSIQASDAHVDSDNTDDVDNDTIDPIGTPNWMAPEVILLHGTTAKADVWAVGCTIIELLTGNPPYYDLNPSAALYRIVNDDMPPLPQNISANLGNFLFDCFKKDLHKRPSAAKLLNHPWVSTCHPTPAPSQKPSTPRQKSPLPLLTQSIHLKQSSSKKDESIDDWGDDFDIATPPSNPQPSSLSFDDLPYLLDDPLKATIKTNYLSLLTDLTTSTTPIITTLDQLIILFKESPPDALTSAIYSVGIYPILSILSSNDISASTHALTLIVALINLSSSTLKAVVVTCLSEVLTFTLTLSTPLPSMVIPPLLNITIALLTSSSEVFLATGGLKLVVLLLSSPLSNTTIDILKALKTFLNSQKSVRDKFSFCARGVVSELLLRQKVVTALFDVVVSASRVSITKEDTNELDIIKNAENEALEVLTLIIEGVVRDETQFKPRFATEMTNQEVINALLESITKETVEPNGITADVLFSASKLLRHLLTDTIDLTETTLYSAKILPFLLQILVKCLPSSGDDTNKKLLVNTLKSGSLTSVMQCLVVLSTSLVIGKSVCSDLAMFPGSFELLRTYCSTARMVSKPIEELTFAVILSVACSLTKKQNTSDFVTAPALQFVIAYCARNGILPQVFRAVRVLYEANTLKGIQILSEPSNVNYLINLFNKTNFAFKEFCTLLADHEELTAMYSKTTLPRGVAVLLKLIPCAYSETKRHFAILLSSLFRHHPNLPSLAFKDQILTNLKCAYDDAIRNGKLVISNVIQESIDLLLDCQDDSLNKLDKRKSYGFYSLSTQSIDGLLQCNAHSRDTSDIPITKSFKSPILTSTTPTTTDIPITASIKSSSPSSTSNTSDLSDSPKQPESTS
ncbi:non-specific serine/threonine protein kinase [Entamoeba marina]